MERGEGHKNQGRFGAGGPGVPRVPPPVFLYVNAGKRGVAKKVVANLASSIIRFSTMGFHLGLA